MIGTGDVNAPGASAIKIGSVVVNCRDFEAMFAFWAEALHYVPREPAEEGWVVLRDPQGHSTNLSLNQVEAIEPSNNRLHFDLYTADQETEVTRLLALGAKRHERVSDQEKDFVVLADPDGNLFCVVHKDPPER